MLTLERVIRQCARLIDFASYMYQITLFGLRRLFHTMGWNKRSRCSSRNDDKYDKNKRQKRTEDTRDKSYQRHSSSHSSTFSEDSRDDINSKFTGFEDAWSRVEDKAIKFRAVKEIVQDLFEMDEKYALAHCVAADLRMGAGIAVAFKKQFKRVEILKQQEQKVGGVAYLKVDGRYIYYLVTKKYSNGKPTYLSLFQSLTKMKSLMEKRHVKLLAVPCLGCGLDRLEWSKVKFMLEYLFKHTKVKITVCLLEDPSPPFKKEKPIWSKIKYEGESNTKRYKTK